MDEPDSSISMQVEFRMVGGRIEVLTDGSRMGTYDSYPKAGEELADEFHHRAHAQFRGDLNASSS